MTKVWSAVSRSSTLRSSRMMLSMNSSVSLWNALTQTLVEVREERVIRSLSLHITQVQPLLGKVVDQGARTRVRQHPPHLLFQPDRVAQVTTYGRIEQRVVRNAAPEEKRQARGKLEVADAIHALRSHGCGIPLDPKQEFRTHEQPLQRVLDARVESALSVRVVVERQQQSEIGVSHRAAIGTSRQRREDLTAQSSAASPCAAASGRHTKMRARLGVSPAPTPS